MQIIKLNRQIKKRLIFLFIIFFCFAFSIFLISYTLKDQIAYFVSPTELQNMDLDSNKYLRVGGLVKPNSLKFQNEKWNFEVADEEAFVSQDGPRNRNVPDEARSRRMRRTRW